MRVYHLTTYERFLLWWELEGELGLDVLTYYGICSVFGYIQGWYIGSQICRVLY